MAQVHGRNAAIAILDSAGTSRALGGDLNNITLSWTRDNAEATTMGLDSKKRISGIRDATLTGAGVFNSGTGLIDLTLSGIMAASLNTLINFAPGGSISGSPLYSGCFLLSAYSMTAPLNGVVTATYTFQLSSGSITVGTV